MDIRAGGQSEGAGRGGGPLQPLPLVSLFCGAGGMDLGFSQAGFSSSVAFDSDPAAVHSFNENLGADRARVADVASLTGAGVLAEIRRCGLPIPVGVIGGPPCQGFSGGNVSGKKRDPRNQLPFQFARVLGELADHAPIEFFVFENVSSLLAPRHARRWLEIRRAFKRAGFMVAVAVLDAAAFGLPQTRRRVFLVGTRRRGGEGASFVFPVGDAAPGRTVRDAIGHLPPPAYVRRALAVGEIPFHPNHWTSVPRSHRFGTKNFNRWRSFRLLDWDCPSPTVAYGHREIHIHPDGERRLSIFEAMLLQGFPAEFRLSGTFSQQVTQVCNAVPPPLAFAVGRAVREQVFGARQE